MNDANGKRVEEEHDGNGTDDHKVKRFKSDEETTAERTDIDGIKAGEVLSCQYDVIKRIFSYLPIKDINSCQQVSSQWETIGNIIKQKRKCYPPTAFYWEGRNDSYYEDRNYTGYMDPKYFDSPAHRELKEKLEEFKDNLMIEPKLITVFGSADTITETSAYDEDDNERPLINSWAVDSSYIDKLFPDALIVGTSCRGIIGSTPAKQNIGKFKYNSIEEENLYEVNPCVSMLFVPDWPGAKFIPIDFRTTPECLEEIAQQDEKHIAAVILPSNFYQPEIKDYLKKVCLKHPAISLGGALGELSWTNYIVEESGVALEHQQYFEIDRLSDFKINRPMTSGFVIEGDSVVSATVLIPRKVKTYKGVSERMKVLKDKMTKLTGKETLENSFGFMFACCGRGKRHYRNSSSSQLESSVFLNMFRSTPLVGIFGNGEIGFDSVLNPPENSKPKHLDELLHEYTTVFTVVARK